MSFKDKILNNQSPWGTPPGGDGGRGGNIYLRGDDQLWTLLHLKYKRHIKAGRGGNGSSSLQLSGHIQRFAYYPVGLPNSQLVTLTS